MEFILSLITPVLLHMAVSVIVTAAGGAIGGAAADSAEAPLAGAVLAAAPAAADRLAEVPSAAWAAEASMAAVVAAAVKGQLNAEKRELLWTACLQKFSFCVFMMNEIHLTKQFC